MELSFAFRIGVLKKYWHDGNEGPGLMLCECDEWEVMHTVCFCRDMLREKCLCSLISVKCATNARACDVLICSLLKENGGIYLGTDILANDVVQMHYAYVRLP